MHRLAGLQVSILTKTRMQQSMQRIRSVLQQASSWRNVLNNLISEINVYGLMDRVRKLPLDCESSLPRIYKVQGQLEQADIVLVDDVDIVNQWSTTLTHQAEGLDKLLHPAVVWGMVFGLRFATMKWMKAPLKAKPDAESIKYAPTIACKAYLWLSPNFKLEHKRSMVHLQQAFDKADSKWMNITDAQADDFGLVEKKTKDLRRIQCLSDLHNLVVSKAKVDRARSSRGTFLSAK